MWLSALEIGGAQLRSVTEIAPPQPFLCVNRSPIRYDYRVGAKAIQYNVKIVLVSWSLIGDGLLLLVSPRPEVDGGWVLYKNKQTNKQTKAVLLSFRFPLSHETGSNIFFRKGDLILIVNVNTCERLWKQQNQRGLLKGLYLTDKSVGVSYKVSNRALMNYYQWFFSRFAP